MQTRHNMTTDPVERTVAIQEYETRVAVTNDGGVRMKAHIDDGHPLIAVSGDGEVQTTEPFYTPWEMDERFEELVDRHDMEEV